MKQKVFAILAVFFLFSSLASAQSYTIRIAFNTNLRASYSLDSAVLTSARAGTTLQVVGSHGRWLRVQRNAREYWMASWVSHTRLADSAPPQTQPSHIDNCCFVDRQCDSDQEWTDGYWAFQNGQCAAPPQTQIQVSTKPASAPPADGDNCCFLGWQCHTDEEWARGFRAYQTNECEHPGIAIEGSPGFVEQMQAALDLLRNGSSYWYDFVIRGLDRIRQTPPEVIGVRVAGRTLDLDYGDRPPPGVNLDSHTTHDASMLVHEACHVHRYEAGLEPGGLPGEKACVETEIRVLEDIAPNSSWIPGLRNVVANIERPECQWWWGEYRACW